MGVINIYIHKLLESEEEVSVELAKVEVIQGQIEKIKEELEYRKDKLKNHDDRFTNLIHLEHENYKRIIDCILEIENLIRKINY